jgi:5-methylthioadenosine/S-adenosylhomocysteine deaminase
MWTGSIKPGKQADLVAIALDTLETLPVFDPISQVVYAAGREQVSHVWVAGRCLLRERRLTVADETQLLDKARWWQQRIRQQTH